MRAARKGRRAAGLRAAVAVAAPRAAVLGAVLAGVLAVTVGGTAGPPLPAAVRELRPAVPGVLRPRAPGLPLPAGPVVTPQRLGPSLVCPSGTRPEVQLREASFVPRPTGVATLLAGRRYRIELRGAVANTTSATIRIRAVRMTAEGRPWRARVDVPALVVAGSTVPLAVSGDVRPGRDERADLESALDWEWAGRELRPCDREALPENG